MKAYRIFFGQVFCVFLAACMSLSVSAARADKLLGGTSTIANKLDEAYSGDIDQLALTTKYNGDKDRMHLIASVDQHALLACAAYSTNGEICSGLADGLEALDISEFGWTVSEATTASLLGVGTPFAFLYSNYDGRQVLAFRGTELEDDFYDWVTNVAGTIDPSFLNAAHLDFARSLAETTAQNNQEVTFVGHSLGGRLAQIGTLVTSRPAVVFNTAPLGTWERIRYAHVWNRRDAFVTRFRAPKDPVSVLFSEAQIEVSNRVGEDPHSMAKMYEAISEVARVVNAVWPVQDQQTVLTEPVIGTGAAYKQFSELNTFEGVISENGPYGTVVENWDAPSGAVDWLRRIGLQDTRNLSISLIRQQAFLSDCALLDERHWRVDTPNSLGQPWPPTSQIVVTYETAIYLPKVDAERTFAAGPGKIVMQEGTVATQSVQGLVGWGSYDDLLPFSSFVGGAAVLKRNMPYLDTSGGGVQNAYFGMAFPDRAQALLEAFIRLVRSCQ